LSFVNNTGPGIKATAGYILEQGDIRPILEQMSRGPEKLPANLSLASGLFEILDQSRATVESEPLTSEIGRAAE
jgi:hypothetical protein